jgi:hypothetical protein
VVAALLTVAGAGQAVAGTQTGVGYALTTNPDGSVARWDPCTSIHYVVNADHGGPGAADDVSTAVSLLARASGLRFVYDGPSSAVPQLSYGEGAAPGGAPPLLVSWAAPGQSDLLHGGSQAGEGGWRSWGSSTRPTRIVTGYALLVSGDSIAPGFGPADKTTRGRVLLHELGHAVGLNHTTDPDQVMYPSSDGRATSGYGGGDQAGLTQVGSTPGCIDPVTPAAAPSAPAGAASTPAGALVTAAQGSTPTGTTPAGSTGGAADTAVTVDVARTVRQGSTVTATVTVTHTGPGTTPAGPTQLNLLGGLSYADAGGGTVTGGTDTFATPALASGASFTHTVRVQATSSLDAAGLVARHAPVAGETNVANNVALRFTPVIWSR